jgi:type VI secretion system secreted protein VgrG
MRAIEIDTPLGPDTLLFHRMRASEELSRLAEYQLDLLSLKKDINLDEILGKNVTVKLALPDDSTRYFNGDVVRFAQGGSYGRYYRYSAVVRSWLWFLTRTTDCRIFQDMTVPDIIKKVFGDHPRADFKFDLTGSYRTWTYCVQYRETDFNFVSRLMEEEGIYYYVKHTDGHNTVVLSDSTGKHAAAPGYQKIQFISPEQVVRPELEQISSWDFSREIQPGGYVHDDYDLERPSVDLKTQKTLSRAYAPSDYEIYDYPGHYLQKKDGEQYAGVRIDELGSQFETAHAVTNARGVSVGSLFTLDAYPRDDQNREHLILAASYDLEFSDYEAMPEGKGTSYRCSFVAMSSQQQFRPKRATPKPFVQGPQTAVVVGPAGDEIYTDKYGRVKVQFHWDRYGTKDENSSCWTRVSHPWAGKNWGAVATPRIGQEVIVDFLEGDPDQPIITGRVYNAEQMPPWELPANATQSGVLTRSSKGGAPANANAIRFEDKAGSEQLWIHAERNQDIEVEKDETHWVGQNRKKTIDVDETTEVKNNRTEKVGVDEKITIGANRTEKVGADETITIGANRTEKVGANEEITIGANRTEKVGANESVTIGANETIKVGASRSDTVGASVTQTISGSLTQTVAGGIKITTPGQFMVTAAGGVTFVAPGGTKVVDFQLETMGGVNRETYGSSFEFFTFHSDLSAMNLKVSAIDIDMEGLCNKQAQVVLLAAALQLNSASGASIEKTSMALRKADITIIP